MQNICEYLQSQGRYVGPTVGTSMLPMLKSGRDTVVIQAKTARLAPLDVALYIRGGGYVLHRVIAVTETGYIFRGDNTFVDEIVAEKDVIGVLTEFFRKDKRVVCRSDKRYSAYVRRRIHSYEIRRFFFRCKQRCKRIIKKILQK